MRDHNFIHNCNDHMACKLLNPSLEDLMTYEDLTRRIADVEEQYFKKMRDFDKLESFPMDLLGWCDQHSVYQLPNIEFVQELSMAINDINPGVILEVGSGRGTISGHISKEINKKIILTDDYSWWDNINNKEKIDCLDVINIGYVDAIEKYRPDLVIASWIPYGSYWTDSFRECESVKGYILIGEGQGGCTGSEDDWETNWDKKSLRNVEKYGICKTDHGFSVRDNVFRTFHTRHTDVTYFEAP